MEKYSLLFLVLGCSVIVSMMGCSSDYIRKLPGDYYYYSESHTFRGIHKSKRSKNQVSTLEVPRCVVDYAFDKKHIIVMQIPIEEKSRISEEINQLLSITTLYYWIIDTHTDSIYGPLLYESFLFMKNELSVSRELKFTKSVTDIQNEAKQNIEY